jgi:HK97 family phage prohead protease
MRAASGLTISIDFDQTFTASPSLWRAFIDEATGRGHEVVCITRREDTEANRQALKDGFGATYDKLGAVVLCGSDTQKASAARSAGISVDIWIDDTPTTIAARSNQVEIERRDFAFEDEQELIVESRADGRAAIIGYAAVYNRLSLDLGGFREEIMPGAFDKILNRQRGKQDVVALFNHDSNIVLGRTSSGTLELSSDDKGLRYVVSPPVSRADVLELIQRRDVRGSSFAFTVDKSGEGFRQGEDGKAVRQIREVSGLYDVGPVLVPAYPATSASVAMRSYEAWLSQQAPAAEPEAVAEIVKRSLVRDAAAAWSLRLRNV